MCFPKLFISQAALFPSKPLFPAISPEENVESAPEISRPTGTMPVSEVPAACDLSKLEPAIGPGPFWPKK